LTVGGPMLEYGGSEPGPAEECLMRTLRILTSFFALLVVCGLVCAQAKDGGASRPAKEKPPPAVKVGDRMPTLKVSKILDPKFKSMAEVRGKLVLYEYFQHW
jgi:hypothetical protein